MLEKIVTNTWLFSDGIPQSHPYISNGPTDTSKEKSPTSEIHRRPQQQPPPPPPPLSFHSRASSYQSNYEHLKLATTPTKFNSNNKFSLITSEFLTLTPRRKGQILEKWHLDIQDQNNNNSHFIPIQQQHQPQRSSGSMNNSSTNESLINEELCNAATLKLGTTDLIYSRSKFPSSDLNKFSMSQSTASVSTDNNSGGPVKAALSIETPVVATNIGRKGFRNPHQRDFTIAV